MKGHKWILLVALSLAPLGHAEIVVIVRADSPVQSLTKVEVERIFLKKLKVFPGGQEVDPIGQPTAEETEDRFYSSISVRTKIERKAYWARLMFTGKDRPPKDGGDNEGVKALVASDLKAIGFIDESSLDNRVKVVYRIE